MIIALVAWALIGFGIIAYLNKIGIINSDIPFGYTVLISIVCGPIIIVAMLIGCVIGFLISARKLFK